jgi:uncharacterized protein
MKGDRLFADTHLFLRYLTNDDPDQADAFEQLLKKAARKEILFVTNNLVIAEIVWTLDSYYNLPRHEIHSKVLAILNTPGLEISDADLILQAISWYTEKNVDYIDAYNASWIIKQGIATACTFDRKHYSRFEGFEVMVPGE